MPRTSVSWTCIRSRNLPRRGKLGSEWVVRVEQAVPFLTGRFECDRAEGSVDLAIELEAIHQGSSWQRQTRIEGGGHFAADADLRVQCDFPEIGLGRTYTSLICPSNALDGLLMKRSELACSKRPQTSDSE